MNKVLIQVQKQLQVRLNTVVTIGNDKVAIDEVSVGGGITDIKGRIVTNDKPEVVEWNGEGFPPVGVECWFNFKVTHPQKCTPMYIGDRVVVYLDSSGEEYSLLLGEVSFSKIESPEEKEQRERLEAAYDLYCYAKKESVYSCVIVSFKEFIGDFSAREREEYLAIVDKTNYRKGE